MWADKRMILKNQVVELAKAHFINLNTSGATEQLMSILSVYEPTTAIEEKVRRLELIAAVVASV